MRTGRALMAGPLAALTLGSFMLAEPASAASVNLLVPIASDAPLLVGRFSDNIGSSCTYNTGLGPFRYSVQQLDVTARGSYAYQDLRGGSDIDITVAVYPLNAFDPTSPTSNCISSSDDSASLDLSSADSFTLVVTAYAPASSGSGALGNGAFSLTGPGVASLASEPPESSSDQSPAPWLKAYARASADEICDMDWSASYATWPNNGNGGWVCEQEWVYRQGTWVIAS